MSPVRTSTLARRAPVVLSLLLGLALLLPHDAAAGSGGTLVGRVVHPGGGGGLLVYVVHVDGTYPPPKTHAVMDQRDMHFLPRILPVLLGTTVDFLNSDTKVHNVFSPDHEGYNLGNWPPGQRRSYTFKRLGVYTQLCSLHPTMEAYVVVLQNPFFAITGEDGRFDLHGLPDGHYEMKVWGRRLSKAERARTFPVHVRHGRAEVTLAFAAHHSASGKPAAH